MSDIMLFWLVLGFAGLVVICSVICLHFLKDVYFHKKEDVFDEYEEERPETD